MTESDRDCPSSTESVGQLTRRCTASLAILYESIAGSAGAEYAYEGALRCIVGMLAVLATSEQIRTSSSASKPIRRTAAILRGVADATQAADKRLYSRAVAELRKSIGLGIFECGSLPYVPESAFAAAAQALLAPRPDAPIETLFFQTMPLSWIGQAYQEMLTLRPGPDGRLRPSRERRKAAGIYYTPAHLVSYVVQSALGPMLRAMPGPLGGHSIAESVCGAVILDPAVGGGDFLAESVKFFCELAGIGMHNIEMRARVAANCAYGVDIDQTSVEIARFRVWAASGFADGISEPLSAHIVVGDPLSAAEATASEHAPLFPGWPVEFDAVVGNPPYLASKNGLRASRGAGQLDSYILFLTTVLDRGLVKGGGMLAMVLPDPVLVRSNAAELRRRIISDWTIVSLLHIRGSFSEARVANVVPVLRNAPASSLSFCVARIERAADQRSFALEPTRTAAALFRQVSLKTVLAQPRFELRYLLDDGAFAQVLRLIHGPDLSQSQYEPPFAPLASLNVKSIYRGEEIGKSAIRKSGEGLPILLGGQSIAPYEITWEGCRIPEGEIRKNRERYAHTKILVQKSAPRIVAALDRVTGRHRGYVFPQSVYAIELKKPGIDEYYLLCLLNSQMLSEYIWRTVTAYKFVQPQLEIRDIRALPVRRISFTTPTAMRRSLVMKGLELFQTEVAAAAQPPHFVRLDNFVAGCLGNEPEHSDVVHDLLSRLGREIVDLTAKGRKCRAADTTMRLEGAIAAAETIVRRLYSSRPMQMSLPW